MVAGFDGIICAAGVCALREPPKKQEQAKEPVKTRKPRPNRTRKARWRGELGGVLYQFEYSPAEGLLRVWKHRHHVKKSLTMTDLLHALEGQKLLPL